MRQSLPAESPLGSTVHGRPGFVFKCLQLEMITQPKVIFVVFVSKLISEIIIALATSAKQAAAMAAAGAACRRSRCASVLE